MKFIVKKYVICAVILISTACMRQSTPVTLSDTAPLIMYKTKADYSSYVPVRLSADGMKVIAFPAPQDVKKGKHYRYPVQLKEGYWLDQQGVGPHTAFLNITYPEYAALTATPAPAELMQRILEKQPFTEMYACGKANEYEDIERALNRIIAEGKLDQFRSLLE